MHTGSASLHSPGVKDVCSALQLCQNQQCWQHAADQPYVFACCSAVSAHGVLPTQSSGFIALNDAGLCLSLPFRWQCHVLAGVAWHHQELTQTDELPRHTQAELLRIGQQLPQQLLAPQSLTHQHHHPELSRQVLLAILTGQANALHFTQGHAALHACLYRAEEAESKQTVPPCQTPPPPPCDRRGFC